MKTELYLGQLADRLETQARMIAALRTQVDRLEAELIAKNAVITALQHALAQGAPLPFEITTIGDLT
jgi:hypothetical protein